MTVFTEAGYTLPSGDQPLKHARIAHSRNWLSGGTAVASTTDSDYFEDGPLNILSYEKWKPTGTSSETWEYDHGSSAECDYCVIGAHSIGTSGATVAVEYYDGSAWQTLIAATAPSDDSAIYALFEPVTAQRWRIAVAGAAPVVGVVKFGKALQMQRSIYGGHTPSSLARQVVMRSNQSVTGEILGRTTQRKMSQNTFEWENLTAAWVEANWPDMQRAVAAEPFFIAWRPLDKGDVVYGQTDTVPIPTNMGIQALMSVSLNVTGYLSD